eukprot:358578-Chlamydomonas_euryale.AAC.1
MVCIRMVQGMLSGDDCFGEEGCKRLDPAKRNSGGGCGSKATSEARKNRGLYDTGWMGSCPPYNPGSGFLATNGPHQQR